MQLQKLTSLKQKRNENWRKGKGKATNGEDEEGSLLFGFFFYLREEGEPRMLACCNSSSLNCCSRSMAMISGTPRIRNVVPKIHAALPVLFISFFVTNDASFAARFVCCTNPDCDTLESRLCSSLPFRSDCRCLPCAAIRISPFLSSVSVLLRERERERV